MSASTGEVPGRIFMTYRREDTAYPAAWLFDRLASHFGRNQVFKDIDSIELGDDFVEVITAAVGSCDALLALIGDRWLSSTGRDGQRRLDDPDNFVRLEIEAALARNVRVIPILVEGAQMPRADELPASLARLARRQALELSPARFDADIRRLLMVLDRTIAQAKERARQDAEAAAERRRQVGQLQQRIRDRAAARDWDAVVAASGQLAGLNPAAADPDGLASVAREQIARRRQAEQAAAERQRQVGQLQQRIRDRAAARDWDAVVAAAASWPGLIRRRLTRTGWPAWPASRSPAVARPSRRRRSGSGRWGSCSSGSVTGRRRGTGTPWWRPAASWPGLTRRRLTRTGWPAWPVSRSPAVRKRSPRQSERSNRRMTCRPGAASRRRRMRVRKG